MAIDSPGQYPPLSVVADKEIGPAAQQRQQRVFSFELDSGTVSCGILMSTISLTVMALVVVWSNFHDRRILASNVCSQCDSQTTWAKPDQMGV